MAEVERLLTLGNRDNLRARAFLSCVYGGGLRLTKIRHSGLLGNHRRHQRVPLARAALETSPLRFAPSSTQRPAPPAPPPLACPHCQGTDVRCSGRVERSGTVRLFHRKRLRPDAAAPSNPRGKQRARIAPVQIPHASAGRAAYLASLFGE